MSLRKMQNAQINLKQFAGRKLSGIDGSEEKSEHRKKFEEKIKQFDRREEKAAPDRPVIRSEPGKWNKKNSTAGTEAEIITDLRQLPVAPADGFPNRRKNTKYVENERNAKYKELKFPDNFLWGTSTSAYQIEGGNKNDWSEWERSAKRLQQLMKKNKNSANFICGSACDSYNRYQEDLDSAVRLNNNAIRFGLEWSRIEPKKGTIDIEAVNYYLDMMEQAKKNGLKTVLTLWHWTNPLWLIKEGGWANKKAVIYYSRYVDLVIKEFGSYVDYWVTLNEPVLWAAHTYISGKFPPGKRKPAKYFKIMRNLAQAHNQSYKLIHDHFPGARVGITKLTNYFEPAHKWCPVEQGLAKVFNYFANSVFFNKIKNHQDYIGLDYYFHNRIVWYPPFKKNKNKKLSDVGWEIYPQGIYYVLKYLHKFKKPILILENGLADQDDKQRADFIRDHLRYVHRAIGEGVDVRGYFYWSLLDNFEWENGYAPKFGLYAVDRRTFERTPRPSARVYAEICRDNKLKVEI